MPGSEKHSCAGSNLAASIQALSGSKSHLELGLYLGATGEAHM